MKNKQIRLARRPSGAVQESDFLLVETEVPPLRDGQVLARVHYLSLDPYMRGRMDEEKSYAPLQGFIGLLAGENVGKQLVKLA